MSEKVEENFPKSRIHSFLKDIQELCKKHEVSIYTGKVVGKTTTILHFLDWETFSGLEVYPDLSSVYWPRIESHVTHEDSRKEISWEEKQGIAQPSLHQFAGKEKS